MTIAPLTGKKIQILLRDWLPERARWRYLTRLGLTAVSRKKKFPEIHVINPFDKVCWVKMAGYWLRILSEVMALDSF